jgi:hypothetical protein
VRFVDPSGLFISGTAERFMEGGDSQWIDMRVGEIISSVLMIGFCHALLGL